MLDRRRESADDPHEVDAPEVASPRRVEIRLADRDAPAAEDDGAIGRSHCVIVSHPVAGRAETRAVRRARQPGHRRKNTRMMDPDCSTFCVADALYDRTCNERRTARWSTARRRCPLRHVPRPCSRLRSSDSTRATLSSSVRRQTPRPSRRWPRTNSSRRSSRSTPTRRWSATAPTGCCTPTRVAISTPCGAAPPRRGCSRRRCCSTLAPRDARCSAARSTSTACCAVA